MGISTKQYFFFAGYLRLAMKIPVDRQRFWQPVVAPHRCCFKLHQAGDQNPRKFSQVFFRNASLWYPPVN